MGHQLGKIYVGKFWNNFNCVNKNITNYTRHDTDLSVRGPSAERGAVRRQVARCRQLPSDAPSTGVGRWTRRER